MEESVAHGAAPRPLGEVLSSERERQNLARADIAQRLHMSPWQVEALEAGDYSRLPKGPFLRGFVRNYARALHLDPEKLLPLLADVAPSQKAASIVVPSEKIRFDPMGQRLSSPYVKAAGLAAVAVLVGFAAMYWWFFIKPTPPATEARKPATSATPAKSGPQQVAVAPMSPAEAPPPTEAPKEAAPPPEPPKGEASVAPKAAESSGLTQAEQRRADVAKAEAVKAAANPTPPPAAPPATPAPGEKKLAFRFSGESWVEIKDARGRTLMSKLNPPGSASEVYGRAPFTVIVGNAPEVQMSFDDRPYDLQPHSRVGVARITVQ